MINAVQSFTKEELEAMFDLVSFEYHASDFIEQDLKYRQTIISLNEKLEESLSALKKVGSYEL